MADMTMREALEYLIERADDSDGAQYGTLSTSFVRDICKQGLAKLPVLRVEVEDDGSFTAVTDYWPTRTAFEERSNG